MQRHTHISAHGDTHSGWRERLRHLLALGRMTALAVVAGIVIFFQAAEYTPAAEKAQTPGAGNCPALKARGTQDRADRFAAMDKNGDGRVVIEEFRAAFPGMNEQAFAVIDTNGDGGIERAEWAAFTENHAAGMRPGQGGPMGMRPERGAPMNNMPGDPIIPPPDSADLPLMRPPSDR